MLSELLQNSIVTGRFDVSLGTPIPNETVTAFFVAFIIAF